MTLAVGGTLNTHNLTHFDNIILLLSQNSGGHGPNILSFIQERLYKCSVAIYAYTCMQLLYLLFDLH